MRFRLLDLLACPYDGCFPLELTAETTTAVVEEESRPHCEAWCGFLKAPVRSLEGPCAGCSLREIENGSLNCPTCQRVYPIRGGIPRLLPDELVSSERRPEARGWRIKWQQMRQRDREAEIFEQQFLPYQTRLDAKTCLDALGLDRDDRLLDAGTGVGRLLEFAYSRCGEIVALDFSERSLLVLKQRSRERRVPLHLVIADVEQLPFRDRMFDRTLSFGILEHLPDAASCRATLQEMRRTMRAGGTAAVTAYNFTPLRRRLAPLFGASDYQRDGWHDDIFFHRFDATEFEELIQGVFVSVPPLRGLRNLPKWPAALLEFVCAPLDRLLSRLGMSRMTGYYLLARPTSGENSSGDKDRI